MEYIGPALYALAGLVLGMALIAWRKGRKGRVYFVVFDKHGNPGHAALCRGAAWDMAIHQQFGKCQPALRESNVRHMEGVGYRCARVRVTEIGGE